MRPRPFVLINVAATVDGKIDTIERKGAAISSARDRARVDHLRSAADAVMVGPRTLLNEDPRLTVRSPQLQAERVARGQPPHPTKVSILGSPGLQPNALFLTEGPARIILFCTSQVPDEHVRALRACGAEVHTDGAGRVDLCAALETLSRSGIQRLLVEGGGSLNFELLRQGLVDEIQVFISPMLFGGAAAPTLADGLGLGRDAAIALDRTDVEVWDDGGVVLRYAVRRPAR